MEIPSLTTEQMKQVDSLAVKFFGLDILQLMENAGRNVAETARLFLGKLRGKEITILCGKGNNGGDGLVAARWLINWGAKIKVILACHPDELSENNRAQLGVLRSMFADVLHLIHSYQYEDAIKRADLIIDGLIGYGIQGDPQGLCAKLIEFTNQNAKKVLAIDIPSGLNPDTGEPYKPCIKADATITFCLPKRGLLEKSARDFVGKIYLGDIGIPTEVFEKMGLKIPKTFEKESLIKL